MERVATLDPARVAAAFGLLAATEPALRRTARRFSLCADDADDAFQRALEILLTKAPALERPRLAAWMHVVTRREALALRRSRERLLGASASARFAGTLPDGCGAESAIERLPSARPDPIEHVERRERVLRAARLLAVLKPQERRAIVLQAEGYSYAEICQITGWTYTKTNRCLAEGRARLRQLGAMD
jgi:RNA polymerase sigma factor (sigma-70 family)